MRFSGLFTVFILGSVMLIFQHCLGTHASVLTKKYPPGQLKEDAKLLQDVVMEMHPAVGLYQPRNYYTKLFDDFIQNLNDSLTEKQFRLKTKLILEELHCGHTDLLFSSSYYRAAKQLSFNFSPYVFLPLNQRAYMIANLNKKQDSTLKRGQELIGINGITVDSMFRHSKRFISADGMNQTCKEHFLQLGFNSYYPGLFGRPDTFVLEYKEGEFSKKIRVPALKLRNLPPLPLGPKDDSLFTRYRRAKINYRFLDAENNTMVMKIEKFSHTGANYAYRKLFRKLKRNNSKNLVIDLRDNGGGSLSNSYKLLRYLMDTISTQTLCTQIKNYPYRKHTRGNVAFQFTKLVYTLVGVKSRRENLDCFMYRIKPKKNDHFNGRIFVLINGGSFSASCLVAAYLRVNPRVTLVGEETGGTREGCNAGVTPYYKLPNTKLRVRVPAFRIINDISPDITGRGIFPDYKTEYSLKDIFSKKDLELEKVKELINTPQ